MGIKYIYFYLFVAVLYVFIILYVFKNGFRVISFFMGASLGCRCSFFGIRWMVVCFSDVLEYEGNVWIGKR